MSKWPEKRELGTEPGIHQDTYNMESTRVVTTAEVRSKPFSYNGIFVVIIVGLGKKIAA